MVILALLLRPSTTPLDHRDAAYRRAFEHGDKLTARLKDVPENEVESVIDEGADYVRHNPPMRIVLDTGILVRATARATGPGWEFLLEIVNSGHALITSPNTF